MATLLLLSQTEFGEDEGIDKQKQEQARAYPTEHAGMLFVAGMYLLQLIEEIHHTGELEHVDEIAEGHGTENYRKDINQHGAQSQRTADEKHGCEVACRSRHEHNQGGTRREALHHQSHGNGYAARGTEIHGHGYAQDKEHAGKRIALEDGKVFRGDKYRDCGGHHQAYYQPFAYVFHHVHIGIGQCFLDLGEETLVTMAMATALALLLLRMTMANVLSLLLMRVATAGMLLYLLLLRMAMANVLRLLLMRMTTAGMFFGLLFLRMATTFLLWFCLVHDDTTEDGRKQGGYGAHYGKGKSHEGECGYDGIHTRLRGGYEERHHGTLGGTFFPERHGRGYHSARAQRQGYAQQGGIEHATERLARKILGIELAWHEGVHQACQQKAQQQVGRHAGNQINNFLHTCSKIMFPRAKVRQSPCK